MTVGISGKSNGTQGALSVNGTEAFAFDATGVDSPFTLTAVPSGNAMVLTLKAGGWRFRSTTTADGTPTYVKTDTDLTLTVSSGSTLGTTNAVQSDILVRVINDAGTLRLSAENAAGGMDTSETGLISTTAEGGAGGADSATTIYSGTAVTSKAYRVAGIVRSTQATAGTWVTTPSLVQSVGGSVEAASAASMVRLQTPNGNGSTNTCVRRFSSTVVNRGSAITYADSSTAGGTFTINTPGVYHISYSDSFSGATNFGLSVNSTQLTTAIGSITATDRLQMNQTLSANANAVCAWAGWLNAGDVIRAHTSASPGNGVNPVDFCIVRAL